VLWIHAVSVGEVNICTQMIAEIERRVPNLKIIVSTTTSTGMGELQRRLPSHIQHIYYPIDRRHYVNRAMMTLHPQAIVLVEAEVWPNFLWRAEEATIPVFLVNARLSKRSYRGYRRFGFLFRRLFASLAGVGCQNEEDQKRLIELGCRPETVRVVGNLKFDAAKLEERRVLNVPKLLAHAGIPENARLLVAGSTHAGEEAILGRVFLRLRQRFPELYLVVVPRHFERARDAGRDLAASGVKFAFRSEISGSAGRRAGDIDCLLVNTTGELRYFYEHAAVIFVGKSLTAEGGQNPIEPGALAKPMVFGPNMQNFEVIAKAFVEARGAIQVQGEAELEAALARLLENSHEAAAMGANALGVVRQNQGAIERTVDMIVANLSDSEVYIARTREHVPAT
jgi:3-deoxy-D-manno-octulosonic-acid transferase